MSLVIHNLLVLQSVSRELILRLHKNSFMNKKTREEIVTKLVAVDGFPPSVVCNSEFICQAFSDNICFLQQNGITSCNQYMNNMKLHWMS